MFNNLILLFIVLIGGVIAVWYFKPNLFNKVLTMFNTKKESFNVIGKADDQIRYSNVVKLMNKKIGDVLNQNIVLTPSELESFKMNIQEKAMALFNTGNRDKISDNVSKWVSDELTNIGKQMTPKISEEISKNVISITNTFTEYKKNKYELPIIGLDADNGRLVNKDTKPIISTSEPISSKFSRKNGKIELNRYKTIPKSGLVKTINEGHMGLKKRNYMGINSDNLTMGIKRHGFSPFVKGKKDADFRGKPEALLLQLAARTSTRDKNGITMYAGNDVRDILLSSGSFGNRKTYNKVVDEFLTKTNDNEYNVFKNISGRFIEPKPDEKSVSRDNIMKNIKKLIVSRTI